MGWPSTLYIHIPPVLLLGLPAHWHSHVEQVRSVLHPTIFLAVDTSLQPSAPPPWTSPLWPSAHLRSSNGQEPDLTNHTGQLLSIWHPLGPTALTPPWHYIYTSIHPLTMMLQHFSSTALPTNVSIKLLQSKCQCRLPPPADQTWQHGIRVCQPVNKVLGQRWPNTSEYYTMHIYPNINFTYTTH